MKILLINHYAGSIRHGMEYRPYYMGREWTKLGHEVTVVAASYSHVRSQQPQLTKNLTEEDIDGIRYLWLRTPSYSGNGLGRVLNILAFVRRLLKYGHRLAVMYSPDVVIASSTYPLDMVPARRIAAKTGAKLIFEVHDLWPLSPMEIGGMPRWHPFISAMQWAEDYAYRHCDRVISMLPNAESHMLDHGLAPGKFVYVPNGIDTSTWLSSNGGLPQQHQDVLDGLRGEDRFVVGYAGAHGAANALNRLLEAAHLVIDDPISFVLVGQGPEKDSLLRSAAGMDLGNVTFLPPVPRACVPDLLVRMDCLYIGLTGSPLFRFGVSPNKLMDYMMAAKPIIHSIEAANDLVKESGCGVSVPAEDPQAVADAVRRLMRMDPDARLQMGMRGRDFVMRHHDYPLLAGRFLDAVS